MEQPLVFVSSDPSLPELGPSIKEIKNAFKVLGWEEYASIVGTIVKHHLGNSIDAGSVIIMTKGTQKAVIISGRVTTKQHL